MILRTSPSDRRASARSARSTSVAGSNRSTIAPICAAGLKSSPAARSTVARRRAVWRLGWRSPRTTRDTVDALTPEWAASWRRDMRRERSWRRSHWRNWSALRSSTRTLWAVARHDRPRRGLPRAGGYAANHIALYRRVPRTLRPHGSRRSGARQGPESLGQAKVLPIVDRDLDERWAVDVEGAAERRKEVGGGCRPEAGDPERLSVGDEVRVVEFDTERPPEFVALLPVDRSEEHTSELQSRLHLVCRLLLEKKKDKTSTNAATFVKKYW